MRYWFVFVFAVAVFAGCGDDGDLCTSYCATFTECYPEDEQIPPCEPVCRDHLETSAALGADCGDAVERLAACVGALPTCDAVYAYWDEIPPNDYPCKAGDDSVESLCAF